MTVHLSTRLDRLICGTAALLAIGACATIPFDRALDAHQWPEAATAFDADTSLRHNERALFRAAMLYSFPNRATYDPARARTLFEQLLRLYPTTSNRQAAVDQLALLYELERVQTVSQVRQQTLESKIAMLAVDTLHLHTRLDSIAVRLQAEQDQSALLRKVANRLENDLQDREAQLRALHDELNHLKSIDLRPSIRTKMGDTSNRVKKVPVR